MTNYGGPPPNSGAGSEPDPEGQVLRRALDLGADRASPSTPGRSTSPPTSLEVLWDPAHKGRVSIRDDALEAVQFAALATGQDINDIRTWTRCERS
jgi:spermidine/putrescine transport system substrate-binding protein